MRGLGLGVETARGRETHHRLRRITRIAIRHKLVDLAALTWRSSHAYGAGRHVVHPLLREVFPAILARCNPIITPACSSSTGNRRGQDPIRPSCSIDYLLYIPKGSRLITEARIPSGTEPRTLTFQKTCQRKARRIGPIRGQRFACRTPLRRQSHRHRKRSKRSSVKPSVLFTTLSTWVIKNS